MILIEEKKRFNIKKIVLSVLGLLVIVGVIWFFRVEISSVTNRVSSDPVITFPAIEERTLLNRDFDNNSVALEISRFISEGAKDKSLWRLKYANMEQNQTFGFELDYQLDLENYSLIKFYQEKLKTIESNGWKLLSANIGDSQMFLDIERRNPSAGYGVRISAEQKGIQLDVRVQYLIIRD